MIFLVQIEDVDVIGAEPLQAFISCLQHPAPRQADTVWIGAHGVGELCRKHPGIAVVADRAPHDLFGCTLGIGVRGVDEIDAGLVCFRDDAL
ncbi:hypothetical protein ACVWWG_003710 [Bradyrhizobium sp. LB7.2]